jgi:hypothetical protein
MIETVAELLIATVVYLVVAGGIQTVAQIGINILLLPLIPAKGLKAYKQVIKSVVIFNLILLIWGCIGNFFWVLLAQDRLYVTNDPIVEWFPYIPSGKWVYSCCGHLVNGATDDQLWVLWASIAALVWSMSWVTYRKMRPLPAQLTASADSASGAAAEL